MGNAFKFILRPPARLRPLPERWVRVLRPLWMLVFVCALGLVVAGTLFALRDTYEVRPAFLALGLEYQIEDDGRVTVEGADGAAPSPILKSRGHILAIDGQPVAPSSRVTEIARRLAQAPGPVVTLDLEIIDGRPAAIPLRRDTRPAESSASQIRNIRTAARLGSALLACGALLFCSFLLARRRPGDPVALLFAFAFAGIASTIDPPIIMWMTLGWPAAYDIISSIWFYLLLIALAVFPDGIFVPKVYRWIVIPGLFLAVFVSLPNVDANLQVFLGIAALLAMLVGQFIRYRRSENGIERQQIKWAAFGFTVGLTLLAAAFIVLGLIPDNASEQNPWVNLTALLLFSLGMAAIPLGLLVALTRFRLWEADTVITRSAAFAVVSAIVGVVWAISTDLAKFVIASTMGQEHQASATAVGAIIAAGIFGPAQSVIMSWTRRRFGGPGEMLAELPEKLREWSLIETPNEIATRALDRIGRAIHPAFAAVMLDGRDSPLATFGQADQSDDARALPLLDEGNRVGTLIIGRRSDGNAYTHAALAGLDGLLGPLARALRATAGRHSREEQMQQMIDQMAARLAQLEGGSPKPA